MELLQLKYFAEAARQGNITRAAESLFIAQPSLSQTIARLEKELGVKLLERCRTGVRLTPSGRYFLDRVEPLLENLDNASQMLRLFGEGVNRTIYLNVLAASPLATDMVIQYRRAHPDVVFRITRQPEDSGWSIRLSGYRGDGAGSLPAGKVMLLFERIMLAVPREYDIASLDEVELSQTAHLPYLTYSENMPYNALCRRMWEEGGISPSIILESDNPESMRRMMCEGIGVAFWPQYSWGQAEDSRVKLVNIRSAGASRAVTVEKNPRVTLSPAEEDFWQYILTASPTSF